MIRSKNMFPSKRFFLAVSLFSCFFLLLTLLSKGIGRVIEEGSLSISIKGEKVGYESYTWETTQRGYLLRVEGRLTKPVSVEIERLLIEMDKNFIPLRYEFWGTMGGVRQEIASVISDGFVENTVRVSGQEQMSRIQITRDALLLPNPVLSPYVIVGKRFGCGFEGRRTLSAYIIPQIETPLTINASDQNPCLLFLQLGETFVELEIDEGGRLKKVHIPSQNLLAVGDSYSSGS